MQGHPATPRVLKVLATVVGSEERRQAILESALASSGQRAMPEKLEDLRIFVRAHLVPVLSAQVGGRLATVVLEDIDAAIEKEIRKEQRRTLAGAVVEEMAAPSSDLRRSSTEVRSAPTPPPSSAVHSRRDDDSRAANSAPAISVQASSGVRRRSAVLVVDRDRVGASMLARSIIHHGFDVAVSDAAGVDGTLAGGFFPDVIVLSERDALDMVPALRSLLLSSPNAALLVRSDERRHLVESILQSVGTHRHAWISRSAPTLEIVGMTQKLAAAS